MVCLHMAGNVGILLCSSAFPPEKGAKPQPRSRRTESANCERTLHGRLLWLLQEYRV